MQTLGRAVELAEERGFEQIYLERGRYQISANLAVEQPHEWPDRLSVYGGFEVVRSADGTLRWSRRNVQDRGTLILVPARGIRVRDLTGHTEFQSVTLRPSQRLNPPARGSSVTVTAINVGEFLHLRDVEIESLDGSDGREGQDGSDLPSGLSGGAASDEMQGLGGGSTLCGFGADEAYPGGDGGTPGVAGDNGAGSAGVEQGGRGGGPAIRGMGSVGENGANGDAGQDGLNGLPSRPDGRITADFFWLPHAGSAARPGSPGDGGGGGGGGSFWDNQVGLGYGGGGGAGGCPGGSGAQGSGGYASIGLLVVGGRINVFNLHIRTGNGGRGGVGGRGAFGSPGGVGGNGFGGLPDFCVPDCPVGGDGGRGGDGGCGGHGSGGAGGPSIGVLRVAPRVDGIGLSQLIVEDVDTPLEPRGPTVYTIGLGGDFGNGGERAGCGIPAPAGVDGLRLEIGCCHAGPSGGVCGGLGQRDLACD